MEKTGISSMGKAGADGTEKMAKNNVKEYARGRAGNEWGCKSWGCLKKGRWIACVIAAVASIGAAACSAKPVGQAGNICSDVHNATPVKQTGSMDVARMQQSVGMDATRMQQSVGMDVARMQQTGSMDAAKSSQEVLKRMFKVKGKLYIETGETNSMLRCGMMDGQITSSVAADRVPKKNGQSNFGKGYGYQYGTRENRLEVCIDGTWHIFAYNENNFDGVSMRVVKNSASAATLEIVNTTDLQVEYGEAFLLEKQNKKTGEWHAIWMKEGYGFDDIAYLAKNDSPITCKVTWGSSHGKQKPGTYRIIKEFRDFRGEKGSTVYTLSAQFKIRRR